MALGVCLLFDRESEDVLTQLWKRVENAGVPTLLSHTHQAHYPHISYVVLLDWSLNDVRSAVESLPEAGVFGLSFHAVATFPRGRVCLVPGLSETLVSRQRAVVEAVRATGARVHKHYELGEWLPHASLATRARLDQLGEVTALANEILPLTVRVTRAALIDSGTGERWLLTNLP